MVVWVVVVVRMFMLIRIFRVVRDTYEDDVKLTMMVVMIVLTLMVMRIVKMLIKERVLRMVRMVRTDILKVDFFVRSKL